MKTHLIPIALAASFSLGAAAQPVKLNSCINQNTVSVCMPARSERCQKTTLENEQKYQRCLKDNGVKKAAAQAAQAAKPASAPKGQPGKAKS